MKAQTAISSISTTSSAATNSSYSAVAPSDAGGSISAGTTYTVNYGQANDIFVSSYTVNSTTYNNFIAPDTLILQRTDLGELINVLYDYTSINGSTIGISSRQVTDIDAIYQSGLLNAGYVNLLVNNDDQNTSGEVNDQIERIDIIYRTGLVTSSPSTAMFPIVEMGGNDAIKIAAITSLDADGEPDSFGSLVAIETADESSDGSTDWGDLGTGILALAMRRQDKNSNPIPVTNNGVSLNAHGTAVSFSDLGISANTVIYGYSLFAYDVNTTSHTLTDITTFPTNTQSSVSGLDLLAGVSAAVSSDINLTKATGPGGYIQSLVTWLKANEDSDVTTSTDGSSVTDWQDHWIGNYDATTGRGSPTYRNNSTDNINFNPVVDFTSGTTSLAIANNNDFNTATSYTRKSMSFVFKTPTSFSNRETIYEQGGGTRGIIAYTNTDGNLNVSSWNRASDGAGAPWNNSGNITTISSSLSTSTTYILTIELDGSNSGSGNLYAYLNGASIGSLSNVGLLYAHSGDIELGASGGGTQYDDGSSSSANPFSGYISEFIYCNEPSAISSTTRQKTESYLAIKYGITLNQSTAIDYFDSAGNKIFDATNNASIGGYREYNAAIAGIGRDDNSELDQRKSKSESSGSILTVEKTSAFASDDTWMIWGHDGGATSTTTSDVPATISNRLTREWRIAETNGEVGAVTLAFDLTGLGLSATASDFSLLVASSTSGGSFTSATIVTGGTLSNSVLTFSNVSLSDKEYIALGTGFTSCAPGGVSSNLVTWLQGDKGITLSGAEVTLWEDQQGSHDASSVSGNRPDISTGSINFNNAVDFVSSNSDYLSASTGGFYTNDYFIVFQPDNTINSSTTNQSVFTADRTGGDFDGGSADFAGLTLGSFTSAFSNEIILHGMGGASTWRSAFTGSESISSGQPYIFNVKDNAAVSPTGTDIYQDGVTINNNTAGSHVSGANLPYVLGAYHDLNPAEDFFDGKIAEVITFSSRLDDANRRKIQSYLAIKYGITLDQSASTDADKHYYDASGNIIWSATANSSYNDDIAGIGRDDDACFAQKQSKSVNSSAILTIGLGTIATNNQSNNNNFSSNGDYLIWGHDGTSASTTQTTDVPGTVTTRLSRIWHVEETGTVSNTEVAFDLTGLGLSSTASDFQLIISSSVTMASGNTISGGTLNGNVLTFGGINFSDEDYFTLGTARSTCGPGGVTTDLTLWLQGNEGTNTTTDNTNITSWSDQSGNSNNASQQDLGGSSLQQPSYQVDEFNFNPIIRFSDPSSTNATYLQTSANAVSGNMTLISVFASGQNDGSSTDFESSPALISASNSGSTQDYGLGLSEGRLHLNAANNSTLNARSTATYNDNVPRIATGTRQQAASGVITLYMNSASIATGTSDNNTLNAASSFAIGNHPSANAASQFQGDIAETLVFSDVLTSDERNRVESYLALKYGITRNGADDSGTGTVDERDYRSSQSTVFWDYSLQSGTYNNGIAGIGKDDNACLSQTKSKSINSGAIVTMEITSTFGSDESFLMWGNDGQSLESVGNSERVSGINSRLNREWYIQETGSVGEVNVTFDLKNVTGPTGVGTNNLTQLRLMVDTDNDFSSGVTTISPSSFDAVNETVTFSVDWSNGAFFTLGSQEEAALPITLLSFEAEPNDDNEVDLNWTTTSEVNNLFYSIERSANAVAFEVIATLDGAGNSNELLNYSWKDTEPLWGRSFYRLKQTDSDSTFSYSEIRSVELSEEKVVLKAFPNPVSRGDVLKIAHTFYEGQLVQVLCRDTRGQKLLDRQITIPGGEKVLKLPTDKLAQGVNLIMLIDEFDNFAVLKVLVR